MTDGPLTSGRVLEAAQDVLRRFGPGKATVVDVARALGVSHGTVYRHFPSKAALRDAVVADWLSFTHAPLHAVLERDEPAPEKLRDWARALHAAKRGKALEDPELFATYSALAADASDAIAVHVGELRAQVTAIVTEGVARGELEAPDPGAAARAVLDATARFHDPVHAASWAAPETEARLDAVLDLLVAALRSRSTPPRG